MIFVDTGAWFARYVTGDIRHAAAKHWFTATIEVLVTTDYVVDELMTLLKVRGMPHVAYALGGRFLDGSICQFERVSDDDLARAWSIFSTFRDKAWSFTDCTSFAVIERLGITKACAFDDHFRQYGKLQVAPGD